MAMPVDVESLGPPRDRNGRLRIDMKTVLDLHERGFSPAQIAKAVGVSDYTIRARLRERLPIPTDPRFAAMGRKGQAARKRALTRRKRQAKAEAERQKDAQIYADLAKLGAMMYAADRLGLRLSSDGDLVRESR